MELVTARGQRGYNPLNFDDMYEVLENVLRLQPEDLETIQMHSPNPRRVDVTTKSLDVWNRKILYAFLEQKYSLTSGKIVRIIKPFEEVTEIRVKRVPSSWSEDDLKRVFSFYGNVRAVYEEKFRANINPNVNVRSIKDIYRGLKNGIWKVKMVVRRAIPSTLIISNFKIEMFYRGQEQTCWRCGRGHRKFGCRVDYDEFINKFSMEEFPELSRVDSVQDIIQTGEQ